MIKQSRKGEFIILFIASKPGIKIFIKIIGNLNKTEYIPLQHSQTNKNPFLSGKKDVFDLTAVDVGHVWKFYFNLNIFLSWYTNFR